jgi:hypothetical protein
MNFQLFSKIYKCKLCGEEIKYVFSLWGKSLEDELNKHYISHHFFMEENTESKCVLSKELKSRMGIQGVK